ncbi:unnamed protein product, partial [Laminaria digitata]
MIFEFNIQPQDARHRISRPLGHNTLERPRDPCHCHTLAPRCLASGNAARCSPQLFEFGADLGIMSLCRCWKEALCLRYFDGASARNKAIRSSRRHSPPPSWCHGRASTRGSSGIRQRCSDSRRKQQQRQQLRQRHQQHQLQLCS